MTPSPGPMRCVFLGSSAFAVPSLAALIRADHVICRVYTRAPAPAGRGKRLHRTPVHTAADEHGLDIATPGRLDDAVVDAVRVLQPDVAILVSYGALIPAAMLAIPKCGFLNIHPSLLPRWRGAAPIKRAIMAGDTQTGVCIMGMDETFDTGMILAQDTAAIKADDTAATLTERLAHQGASLLIRSLATLDGLTPTHQAREGVTWAPKITREETQLDWGQAARVVDAKIRGLSPRPGAWCHWNGNRVKILMSRLAEGQGEPGTVLDDNLTVACGSGAVCIARLQAPSGKTMDGSSFLRGYGNAGRDRFS